MDSFLYYHVRLPLEAKGFRFNNTSTGSHVPNSHVARLTAVYRDAKRSEGKGY